MIFHYDLETTGLDASKNGIHQIAGAIEIDGEIKENFNLKVRPFDSDILDKKALEVGNVTIEQVSNYTPAPEVYKTLLEILSKYVDKYNKVEKFHLCGFNNRSFDDRFLRSWFNKNGDKYFGSWFWSDSIDVMVLASNHLKEERYKMKNFQLSTVAQYLGVEVDSGKLHDGEYDVYLTMEIYNHIKNLP